jgi:TolB-like protein
MSPEQATGERDLDARSDIYALGAVTYEMLAGEPPVTAPTQRAMLAKLMTERPTPLRVVRDAVPPALDSAVMRSLEKTPTDRFASAREFADALTGPATAPASGSGAAAAPATAGPRRARTIAVAVAAIVIVAGGYALVRSGIPPWFASADANAPAVIRSIAVLPLDNYSGDASQEYFAEGMTDELTAALATISQLRVTSRGSAMQFGGKSRPATPEIAKALDVDAVVEGSVSRSGEKVRITVQLIDARADRHLWAKSFDGNSGDVLALQAELAQAIANEINVRLTPSEQSRLATAKAVDPAAHDAYLKGRFFFNRPSDENLQKAIEQFEEAVRLSPTFAPAYSGLSDAYLWAGYNEGFITAAAAKPRARAAAERAVQLDSNSAEAHTSLAVFKLFYDLDWEGSERDFRRAFALNPNYAFAHDQFAMLLAFTGRIDESIAESRIAAALDPLNPQVLVDADMALMFDKDFEGARALARKAAELDPSYFFPVAIEGWIDLEAGKYEDAIPYFEKAKSMGAPPFVNAYLAYAYGRAGERDKAMAELRELERISQGGEVLPFNLALVYLGLGDHARAIDYIEQAHAADSQQMGWLGRDAIFDPLRDQPRFKALMKRLNF